MAKTLINAGWVLSMDPAIGDIENGEILLEDDRILAVGRNLSAQTDTTIDAGNMIVLPGLINAHIHSWQNGLRGIAGNWISADYFRIMHANLALYYTPEDTYLAGLVGALSQISAGSTTIMEWCHNNATPDHSDRAIDALYESGIRAVFGHGTVKPPQKPGQPHFSEIPHARSEIERLRKTRLSSDDSLVTLAMAILGPDYCVNEVMLADFRMAREFALMSSSHVWNKAARVSKAGFRPAADAGLLGPDHNVVHGNFCDDDEIKLFVDCGCSVTSTPTVEMQTSEGDPLIGRILALGASPSLGADSEIFVAGDMFHVMRHALQTQRALDHRHAAANGAPLADLSVSPRQALEWATIEGARALMKDKTIGSLTPGKQADLIMLRGDDINLFPVIDPVQSVVLFAGPENVDTVMIAGKLVKSAGKLMYPTDELAAKQIALLASANRIMEQGGYVHEPV
jgi:cytosine/adenosine deaminase-related metal-dependent hydrolase